MSCCGEDPKKKQSLDIMHAHDGQNGGVLEHHPTIWQEIMCHLPYAIFSVALGMLILSMMSVADDSKTAHRLFHSFHYMHILFAATGTILMFRKYSKSIKYGIIAGLVIPTVFCTLSDSLLPFLGGWLFNLHMHFHWCFISHLDSVLPFLIIGVVNGWVMSCHEESRQLFYSLGFHFFHIFISSMASILYLVSFGFDTWWKSMGFMFGYMILVVLIPCTLADIVVPILFAKAKKKKH